MLSDQRQVAQLAFAHLRESGLSISPTAAPPLASSGIKPGGARSFDVRSRRPGFPVPSIISRRSARTGNTNRSSWPLGCAPQPKPLGIFAVHDDRGYQVLDACRRIDLRVPQEVAVLSVDDDPILCKMAIPPMSSIRFDFEEAGYLAATWLDRLMDGRSARPNRSSTHLARW